MNGLHHRLGALGGLIVAGVVATAAEWSAAELKQAQKLYVAKCAKCHVLYPPEHYTQPVWDDWMVKMGTKSRLKPTQQEVLERFTARLRDQARKDTDPKP